MGVSKLVASTLVLIPALIWADKLVHHAPVHPVHPAPYGAAPAHPAPHPAPGYGYCDPKAPPKCAEGSDLPFCIVDKEYPAYDIALKISQDALFLKKDASHRIGPEGYLCPSDVDYTKITRAVNVEGY